MGKVWIKIAPNPDTFQLVDEYGQYKTLGPGIFKVAPHPNPSDSNLVLAKVADKFTFDYKIYDMGNKNYMDHIKKTWESEIFVEENRNLGVIFNGIRGTGKTIMAKLLCNYLDIPVVLITQYLDGLDEYIASLPFECVVLIDEAEKTFTKETDLCLLKMIDGVIKGPRKLYLLTTNELTLNANLFGRPGRIRYIKEFSNLDIETIKEFLEDNLKDKSKKLDIINYINLLEISTIDILRSIVDEVNIHGELPENSMLNVEKAKYIFDAITHDEGIISIDEFKKIVADINSLTDWNSLENQPVPEEENSKDFKNYQEWLEFKQQISPAKLTSQSCFMFKGYPTNLGIIETEPDKDGVFTLIWKNYDGTKSEVLVKILGVRKNPSLYGNGLAI